MGIVKFTTDSELSRRIIETFAASSARFLKNIARYKKDSDGSYTWAWTGTHVVSRLSIEDERYFGKQEALPNSPKVYEEDLQYPLVINGKLIGHVWMWEPYAYDDCILYLELVPEMQYDGRVVRRLAMFDGYFDKNFDMKKLEVARPQIVTDDDLIFF